MTLLEYEWEKYSEEKLKLSILPEEIRNFGVTVHFEKDDFLIYRGEFPEYIYFVNSGTVRVFRDFGEGNEYSYIQANKRNDIVGLLEVMAMESKYTATVKCVTDVEAIRFDSVVIYRMIMSDVRMLRRCIRFLAVDFYATSENIGVLYYLRGVDRVRFYLVDYYNEHKGIGDKVTLETGYKDIASQIGCSVRTVGRDMKVLKDKGEVCSENRKIVISGIQAEKMSGRIFDIEEWLTR